MRRLTARQKKRAEDALQYVSVGVRVFKARHPSYWSILSGCDLHGVAQMAVVEASITYDPKKSQPQTYYGTAIRHALLKEVRRYQRSREGANERVHLDIALDLKLSHDQRQHALDCLCHLEPADRELIESHVIEGRSLMAIGRTMDRDWRTVKARLTKAFEHLRSCVNGSLGSTSDTPESEPSEPA